MVVAGFGDGSGVMSSDEVASAKSAKSVGEVNSSSSISSFWIRVMGVIGVPTGGKV